MFEIRKGVKMPAYKSAKYPLLDMQIGDSFVATDVDRGVLSVITQRASKKSGFKFSIRKLPEGLGVWRVS